MFIDETKIKEVSEIEAMGIKSRIGKCSYISGTKEIIEYIASYGGSYATKKGKSVHEAEFFSHQIKLKQAERFIINELWHEVKLVLEQFNKKDS